MKFKVHYEDVVSSTMNLVRDVLHDHVQADSGHVYAVQAQRQEQGRGRSGNQWVSKEGNLYLSFAFRPDIPLQDYGQLSFIIALALYEALCAAGLPKKDIRIKWPNDLLVQGRKIAGILLETEYMQSEESEKPFLVIGCGLNIMHAPEDRICVSDLLNLDGINWETLEGFLLWRAAHIESNGPETHVTLIRDLFFHYFTTIYGVFLVDGFSYVQQEYMKKAAFLGQMIKVRLPQETLSGIFQGIDETGALILTLESGINRIIQSGEVFFDRS